jgi:muramoyltetrapeptide carboxypeptidase
MHEEHDTPHTPGTQGLPRRSLLKAAAAAWPLALGTGTGLAHAQAQAQAQTVRPPRKPALRAPRLKPGDTIALVNPSNAVFERLPYVLATEALQSLGFKVREGPNLRAR